MPELTFAYGKGSAKVRVPKGAARQDRVLSARAPAAADTTLLCARALEQARWRVDEPVAVVVPDQTRPMDRGAALCALGPLLEGAAVELVVGAGLHPAKPIASPWPCHVHDARSPDLAQGIHPVVMDARTVIVVSCVMPHYLAGFSGGLKGLVPGVAAEALILEVHERGSEGPGAFRKAIRELAARVTAPLLGLQVLSGPRGPFDAVAGPVEQAHDEAVRRYVEACAQPRPEPADVVVADAGGHPVDATLLQAHKAYAAAEGLVRPGGTIVLIAACEEGFGHEEFRRRLFDPEGPFHPYARTAAEWRRKAARVETLMVTEMETQGLGVERVTLEEAMARIPRGARVLFAGAAQDLLFA